MSAIWPCVAMAIRLLAFELRHAILQYSCGQVIPGWRSLAFAAMRSNARSLATPIRLERQDELEQCELESGGGKLLILTSFRELRTHF